MLLTISVFLAAGCAAIQGYEVRDTERMLAAAGFQTRPAETRAVLDSVPPTPPHRIVRVSKDGDVLYTYEDPTICRCVYVGGAKEYSEYARLMLLRERARHTREGSPSGGDVGGSP